MQISVSATTDWSTNNNTKINATKTKDMVIYFGKEMPNIANI